jgi:hypothetical protein
MQSEATMKAIVVYESMYGNTHVVAERIAAGMRTNSDVEVVPVSEATVQLIEGADLLVVGGPTHVHGISSDRSRALENAASKRDRSSRWTKARTGSGFASGATAAAGDDGPCVRHSNDRLLGDWTGVAIDCQAAHVMVSRSSPIRGFLVDPTTISSLVR